jgi:oxygen-independent coproporphyrinogen-3 oxidase
LDGLLTDSNSKLNKVGVDIIHTDFRKDQPAGLYIHVPFCVHKCSYCDFYSITDLSQRTSFLTSLEKEMQLADENLLTFNTIYIGGGTPTVLGTDYISRCMTAVHRYFSIEPDVETTLELNPGTVIAGDLKDYRNAGINRLNIGVQSFQNDNLQFLSRIHSGNDALVSFEWARQAGFENIGLDLIYGLPGQNKKKWLKDLDRAAQMQPEHISCYMLTRESGTPLDLDMKSGRIHPPAEETVRDLFDTTIDFLTARSFVHYEISSFAGMTSAKAEPMMSKHNLKYWSFAPYIGLGPSAHSFVESMRFWNHHHLKKYIEQLEAGKLPMAKSEILTREQMVMEAIFLGFRTTRGIDLDAFRNKFRLNFSQIYSDTIAEFQTKGMLDLSEQHCYLTRQGLPLLDSIVAAFTNQDIPATK